MEKKLNFDDINWLGKVEDGSIKSLLVKTLNKYFLNYNMTGCLTLKKAAKIEVISRHVRSQSLNALEHNIFWAMKMERWLMRMIHSKQVCV